MTDKMESTEKPQDQADLSSPELYVNRELSWLEFNDRVLQEGLCEQTPLLERLKFLAIVSSNLDEFFMIRVAGLKQQRSAGIRRRDISGLTPVQQVQHISLRVHRMVAEQTEGIRRATELLAAEGIRLLAADRISTAQQEFLRRSFESEILPVLTPLAVQKLDPCPVLPGSHLMVAARLRPVRNGSAEEHVAVVPVPKALSRFLVLPAEQGLHMARIEDAIAANLDLLFPRDRLLGSAVFRITRDADVAIEDDDAGDLLEAVERAVHQRHRRAVVRLEMSADADPALRRYLKALADVTEEDVYLVEGMLDATALMHLAARRGLEHLAYADWPPQQPEDLPDTDDMWQALQDHDVLLFHPYESFEPVVRLIQLAADDPGVLAIKQTLYRTSGDSPIIAALERAARNDKQVMVLVELKARFDEERNVQWARRLEDAGALVIYGIAGYKTHSKALLIVRREAHRIRRYVHLATGNYNDKTAKLYSDIGLMTTDADLAADTAAFFNLLTGYSEAVGWAKLSVAPGGLRSRFLELIDREIRASTPQEPGLIIAKVNSLHDKGICKALYQASRAGVRVRLNIRGICGLRPQVPGVSDNIEVVSIVDRFLEHARIFYFRNGGHEEVYLASADWMTRNLDRRLELLFPVTDHRLRRRLIDILNVFLSDNVKARRLLPDGTYVPVTRTGAPVRAQEALYHQAVDSARRTSQAPVRFKPLKRPEE